MIDLILLSSGETGWLEITSNAGEWIAEDGISSHGLRDGSDLIDALKSTHTRKMPTDYSGLLVKVSRASNGWILTWRDPKKDTRRIVRDVASAQRVFDEIRRGQTTGAAIFSQIEAFAYAGDENDAFEVPVLDQVLTRKQVRMGVRAAHVGLRLMRAISLMPKPKPKPKDEAGSG